MAVRNDRITIRRGQFWSAPLCREQGYVLEILGFTKGKVDVAMWDCPPNTVVEVGCTLQASSGLAGSRLQVPITHGLLAADSALVHAAQEDSGSGQHHVHGLEGSARQKVQLVQGPPTRRQKVQLVQAPPAWQQKVQLV